MKRKALVVFADGSKQMAHDLDDSCWRWYERKVAQAEEIREELADGIALPVYDTPADRDTALIYQAQLREIRMAILSRQSIAQSQQTTNKIRQSLVLARFEIEGALGSVNATVKEFNKEISDLEDFERKKRYVVTIEELRIELDGAKSEIIRLQRLLIDQFAVSEELVYSQEELS